MAASINSVNSSSITTVTAAANAAAASVTRQPTETPAAKRDSYQATSASERTLQANQSLSQAKTAVESASKANSDIGSSLKQVRDVATRLTDDKLSSEQREKLQAQYTQLRDQIIAQQDKATVKSGDQKVNLLTDKQGQTVTTNGNGGSQEVASSQAAKALGLPEKIGSAAEARALLKDDPKKAGTLANAEKTTLDTAVRLSKDTASLRSKQTIASAQQSVNARSPAAESRSSNTSTDTQAAGGAAANQTSASSSNGLSPEQAKLRDQALAQARQAGEQIRNQLSGLTANASNRAASLLTGLS